MKRTVTATQRLCDQCKKLVLYNSSITSVNHYTRDVETFIHPRKHIFTIDFCSIECDAEWQKEHAR